MSVAMNNLEELLKTRWRLITTSCNSLRFFDTIMEREAPSDWNIFKWEPMSMTCIRYVSQAKNEPTVVSDSMRAVWNKKHDAINKEGVDVETVFDPDRPIPVNGVKLPEDFDAATWNIHDWIRTHKTENAE